MSWCVRGAITWTCVSLDGTRTGAICLTLYVSRYSHPGRIVAEHRGAYGVEMEAARAAPRSVDVCVTRRRRARAPCRRRFRRPAAVDRRSGRRTSGHRRRAAASDGVRSPLGRQSPRRSGDRRQHRHRVRHAGFGSRLQRPPHGAIPRRRLGQRRGARSAVEQVRRLRGVDQRIDDLRRWTGRRDSRRSAR